jgi:excinuclease ABC subunit B
MERAISEVERRRKLQLEYNKKHNITPKQIEKPIREKLLDEMVEEAVKGKKDRGVDDIDFAQLPPDELKKEIRKFEKLMRYEAEMLNFEEAAVLRDKVRDLKKLL